MKKMIGSLIGLLIGLVIVLGLALGVFVGPLFQADQMLARLVIEDVVGNSCYLVSLEITPDNDTTRQESLLRRQSLCGDYLGLGYEFALPNKAFILMQKPGIVLRNVVAFDKKTLTQTGNILMGSYKIAFLQSFRDAVSQILKKTPAFKSITYDIKTITQKPKKGAVITYSLEPFRQQVIATCTGCAN